jgi:hypothetical protein
MMFGMPYAGPKLDEARKLKSFVTLINLEQHMALSMHFDALSVRLARRLVGIHKPNDGIYFHNLFS